MLNTAVTSELLHYYGSLGRSIYTLFLSVSQGISWGIAIEPLMPVGATAVACFILFISISYFGVLNIVTSAFVESAMQATLHYRDLIVEDKITKRETYVRHLETIFRAIDKDDSGTLSLDEMNDFIKCEDPQLREYFEALELNASSVRTLFALLDIDKSGSVDIEEFCRGCLRLRGEARSFDINCLMAGLCKLNKILTNLIVYTQAQFDSL